MAGGFEHRLREVEHLLKPGFKGFHTIDVLIDHGPMIESVAGGIGELPTGPAKRVTVIDHHGHKTDFGAVGRR